jgi:hypothetical protein
MGGQFLKTTDRGVKYPLTPEHEIDGAQDLLIVCEFTLARMSTI